MLEWLNIILNIGIIVADIAIIVLLVKPRKKGGN